MAPLQANVGLWHAVLMCAVECQPFHWGLAPVLGLLVLACLCSCESKAEGFLVGPIHCGSWLGISVSSQGGAKAWSLLLLG